MKGITNLSNEPRKLNDALPTTHSNVGSGAEQGVHENPDRARRKLITAPDILHEVTASLRQGDGFRIPEVRHPLGHTGDADILGSVPSADRPNHGARPRNNNHDVQVTVCLAADRIEARIKETLIGPIRCHQDADQRGRGTCGTSGA